jgi:hypothetical protein
VYRPFVAGTRKIYGLCFSFFWYQLCCISVVQYTISFSLVSGDNTPNFAPLRVQPLGHNLWLQINLFWD